MFRFTCEPRATRRDRSVLVLPHWNARIDQHLPLFRTLSHLGISALRLSMPYHDLRMPRELHRADYAVSANIDRAVEAPRQAMIDARSCLGWLETQGYRRVGIVGTSLGSCYSFLTSAQDARLRANVFSLFSLYFADVVWTRLTTRHIRAGLERRPSLEELRDDWMAISPLCSVGHSRDMIENLSLFTAPAIPLSSWNILRQ